MSVTESPVEKEVDVDGVEVASSVENDYISGPQLLAVSASVTLTVFLMLLDSSILATAIPRITNEFHSLPDIGWYASAYQLANSAIQPLVGKLFTYFSSKWLYLIFLFVFEVGSALCGAAVSSPMLIIGRAVAGLGASGLYIGALTILAGAVPLEKRPALTGIMMGCFYINLPIGGVAMLSILLCHVPEQVEKGKPMAVVRDKWREMDFAGAAICALAAIELLLALEYGGQAYSWDSSVVIGLLCGAGATTAVFIAWEWRRGETAMIPWKAVQQRAVWSSYLVNMFLFIGVFTASYYLPIYFQAVEGASPLMSGVYLLPSIISQLIFAVGSGVVVGKQGYYLPWAVFSGAVSAVGAGLITTYSTSTSLGEWIGYQTILGSGRGAGMQMSLIAVQTVVPPAQLSVVMASLAFLQNLGSAIFLTIANTVFSNSLRTELASNAPEVDADAVIQAGATAFRSIVSPEDLPGVLTAYANSFDNTFYIAMGAAVGVFVFAWGMGWNDVRAKKSQVVTDP